MIHTNMPRNCSVFLLPRRLTRSAIYGSQIMGVRKVKGKPRNFEANLCGSFYSTFKTSFQSYAFYNKRLQTLFIHQLDRSKATCSFNLFTFEKTLSVKGNPIGEKLKSKLLIGQCLHPIKHSILITAAWQLVINPRW